MATYTVYKKITPDSSDLSSKAVNTMRIFGLTSDRLYKIDFKCSCRVNIEQGDVIYITGSSGTGKSVLLKMLRDQIPPDQRFDIEDVNTEDDRRVIDVIEADFVMSMRYLCKVGMGDLPAMLSRVKNLSDGQKWRFRLVWALAKGKKFIFADEFCSNLDIITAKTVACNVRKFAKRYKITFVLASCREDILTELLPDAVITRDFSNNTEVEYKPMTRRIFL